MRRAFIGIAGQTVPLPRRLALALGLSQARAVAVSAVEPGSPAARVGLVPGMIIAALAGEPVTGTDDFVRLLGGERIGIPIELLVIADGERRTVIIVPDERERY